MTEVLVTSNGAGTSRSPATSGPFAVLQSAVGPPRSAGSPWELPAATRGQPVRPWTLASPPVP